MATRWTEEDLKRLQATGNITIPELPEKYSGKPAENIPTGLQRYQALGRLKRGEMNKTEERYAGVLDLRKMAGEVIWWAFEPMNLRLADKCFYKVDFLIMTNTYALEIHEVKGYWTDDARVKIKVAASIFPFRFLAVQYVKNEWIQEEF